LVAPALRPLPGSALDVRDTGEVDKATGGAARSGVVDSTPAPPTPPPPPPEEEERERRVTAVGAGRVCGVAERRGGGGELAPVPLRLIARGLPGAEPVEPAPAGGI